MIVQEEADRWIRGLRGEHVKSVSREDGLTVKLASGATISVRASALLTSGPMTAPTVKERQVNDIPEEEVKRFVAGVVLSAVAFKTGALRVVFDTGYHLNQRASEYNSDAYVEWPGNFRWSCNNSIVRMDLFED
jgi:hypothetical protein